MRLLFSSSDITDIGRVGREFIEAGIPCGVRYDPPRDGASPAPAHAELWIQNENDFHRAVALYLRLSGTSQGTIPDLRDRDADKPLWTAKVEGASSQEHRSPAST
jgi:hypothetical protein